MGRWRLWLAGALGVLLVLFLFEGRAGRERAHAPAEPEVRRESAAELTTARAAREEVSAESTVAAPVARASDADELVRVRSSIGVPIERVEWEQTDGAWRTEALSDGAVRIARGARPTRLRAPGHLPAAVEGDTRELVLEPHTSLVFQAFPLGDTESCDPFGAWPSERARGEPFVSAGACGPTSWGIAFDATQLHQIVPELEMVLRFDDGSEAHVTHELVPSRHDVYAWPVAPRAVGRERLRVAVERAEPSESVLEVVVCADPNHVGAPGQMSLWNEKTPFGRVVILDYLEQFEQREGELELGPLVLGKAYLLLARDLATGDHDRLFFTHDGSPRRMGLAHGLRVRGMLDVAPAAPFARFAQVVWRFGTENEADTYWKGDAEHVPVAEDGSFELVLPGEVPISARSSFPRPEGLTLELRAGGFEWARVDADTAEKRVLELGAIRMAPLATQLVLAAGHRLVPEDLEYLELQVPGTGRRAFELSGAQRVADGSLALALQPDEHGAGFVTYGRDAAPATWSDVPAIVLQPDSDAVAFRRADDGSYRREPTNAYLLRVEAGGTLPAGAQELAVGWSWEGIDVTERAWKVAAFERAQAWTFTAPARGAALWWTLDREPTDAHARVALDRASIALRVP